MKRILATVAFAAAVVALPAVPAYANPGGDCDGSVDVDCRGRPCGEDELDCGMKPPCVICTWPTGCLV